MNKISVAQALEIAEQYFPKAPEELVEFLDIEIRCRPLSCDGWCVVANHRAIISLNSNVTAARRRFTLAHELGHLILGIPTEIGVSGLDVQKTVSKEEREVNELAGQILLPEIVIKQSITEIPVTGKVIQKIAAKANVSQVVVARRLASLEKRIGVKNGLVLFFKNGKYEWQWSNTVFMERENAQQVLRMCLKNKPNIVRERLEEGDVIVAAMLENPYFDTQTIFVQLVSEKDGFRELNEERRRNLERIIFSDAQHFQRYLQGCLGAIKSKIEELSLEEAIELFYDYYLNDPQRKNEAFQSRLESMDVQNYIRLRLTDWTTK